MNKSELYKKIMQLSFVKNELELFLDTHPECRAALEHYYRTVDEYTTLLEEYEGKYGPITAAANVGEKWNWIKGPWPWNIEANDGVGADSIDGSCTESYMKGRG